MPRFEPFAGVRYDPARVELSNVVAPPYDVISPDEQLTLEARSPYNAVRIDLPRGEHGVDRYDLAAADWREWRAAGVLNADSEPHLYGYRMSFRDDAGNNRTTIGVVGALGLGDADVLPHERTTPKPKGDRLYLLRATKVNTSPIWGLSPAAGLTDAIPAAPAGIPEVTDDDGVVHQLWEVSDPDAIKRISGLVGSEPVIIADGHHRYETGLAYREEHSAAPDAGAIMTLVVELAEEEISVRAIHRVLSGLPTGFDVPASLAPYFELEPTGPPDGTISTRLQQAGSLALHTRQDTWLLHPKETTEAAAEQDLDSSRLDVALASLPEHEVVFQHGWDLATLAVDRGEADAAILLRPATVAQIAATGHEGLRMPPKTTFFWPKPRTGLVFRELRHG